MGKKNKSGPPYLKPKSTFIIIYNPWGRKPGTGVRLSQFGADDVGYWVRYMHRSLVRGCHDEGDNDITAECVFTRTTIDAVIVQLPLGTEIAPLLGAHRWREFLLEPPEHISEADARERISYIFEYNFSQQGDPAKHNWKPFLPTVDLPPSDMFPVKIPYPAPSWIQRPPEEPSWALQIPEPIELPVVAHVNPDPIISVKTECKTELDLDAKLEPKEEPGADELAAEMAQLPDYFFIGGSAPPTQPILAPLDEVRVKQEPQDPESILNSSSKTAVKTEPPERDWFESKTELTDSFSSKRRFETEEDPRKRSKTEPRSYPSTKQ